MVADFPLRQADGTARPRRDAGETGAVAPTGAPRLAADSLQKAATAASGRGPGRPFRKGRSGNPAGRKPGSRNRKTLIAELLLEGESEALARKAVELALGGNPAALRLCLDRLIAPRREPRVPFALPPIAGPADIAAAMAAVTAAVADGTLSPGEAYALSQTVDACR